MLRKTEAVWHKPTLGKPLAQTLALKLNLINEYSVKSQ